jgi:ABC-type Fe3+ transport system permease subunit
VFWRTLLSQRERAIPVMLSRRGTDDFATAIWGLNTSAVTNEAAASSMILAVMIMVFFTLFQVVSTRWGV